jgi:hypothetical protein
MMIYFNSNSKNYYYAEKVAMEIKWEIKSMDDECNNLFALIL